ncbi:helix-turn-helix domain-containing protein (plasmid) [Citricoccus nitrophenolicus]
MDENLHPEGWRIEEYAQRHGVSGRVVRYWIKTDRVVSEMRRGARFILSPEPLARQPRAKPYRPKRLMVGAARGWTVPEYASAIGVGDTSVYNMVRNGRVDAVFHDHRRWILSDPEAPQRKAQRRPKPLPRMGRPPGLTVSEHAHAFGMNESTVREWLRKGWLKYELGPDGRTRYITSVPQTPTPHPTPDSTIVEGPGLSARQWMAATGAADSTVRKWARDGRVDTVKVQGNLRVLTPVEEGRRMLQEWTLDGHQGVALLDYAAACAVSTCTVRDWIEEGTVKARKIGHRVVVLSPPRPRPKRPAGAMTVPEYAKVCGVTPSSVTMWARRGTVRATKIGRIWYISSPPRKRGPGMTVEEYAQACNVTPTTVENWCRRGLIEAEWTTDRKVIVSPPRHRSPRGRPRKLAA